MKRIVLWSRDALDEIKDIVRYIAKENPQAARKVATAIRLGGRRLGDMATGRRGRVAGTYEKPIAGLPYIIAYALRPRLEGGEDVVILRVIHGSRNWPPEEWPR